MGSSSRRAVMSRVIIADRHPLIRSALRHLLEADGHQIVAEFDDGPDTLQQTLKLRPDLLILGLALPRLGGLEVIRRLRQRESRVPILVLTAQNNAHFASLCLQAGATGFVGKDEALERLSGAVRSVLRGDSHFPANSLASAAANLDAATEDEQLRSLSPREMTVLRYLVNGRSNKEIAHEL